jgi:hypothetical protein
MYNNTTAVYRADINAFLEQAQDVDKKFIFEELFPVLGVPKRSGEYPRVKIGEGGLMKSEATKRNASGSYNEVVRKHSWDNYKLNDRGLTARLDDDKVDEFSDFTDLEVFESRLLKRSLKFDLEKESAATLMDEATFSKEDAKVAYTEANLATIDVPYDLMVAIEKLNNRGVDPNTIVFSNVLWRIIRRSKLLQDYIYGSEPSKKKLIRAKDLADAFAEETGTPMRVLVAATAIDMANRAKDAPNFQPVWGNTHIWLGKTQSGEISQGGMGRTLTWNKSVKTGLFEPESWRNEDVRSDIIRLRSYCDQKVIDETCGQLIKTNWA